ncbi:MAG TPA: HAMP domain-containing sensor histidine kinase, partial [Acidimicrobiales bacterium]|nr:HAMP domain-containing sensor histidine kinase [Acidimicrobiales bacterium]
MRTRITLAFITVIALAVLLAGGGALLLVRHTQTAAAQTYVRRATIILVNAFKGKSGNDFAKQDVQDLIKQIALLNNETVITVDRSGNLVGDPPPGIPAPVFNRLGKSLVSGSVIQGTHNGIAFAAAPLLTTSTGAKNSETLALAFEARADFSSVYDFLLAGLAALVGAALLAALISRRIATRVVRVAGAAARIAGGDFDVRLSSRQRDYPEIAQLDRSINSMAEDLARSRLQEREFLLSISHDLRTPLTSIRGYSEAIADGAAEEPQHAASVVVSEAARLERLIGDLLDLARLRSRQFLLEPTTVDIATAASEAAEALQVAFDAVGVGLSIIEPLPHVYAVADPHRLSQIVANLLENALKYASTTVTLLVGSDEERVTLDVEDDGPGIDAHDLPHVLERLFTSDRHPARSAGTGLGLAIVSELASAMGGSIAVRSPTLDGRGTRITVTLPR